MNKIIAGVAGVGIIAAAALGVGFGAVHDANHAGSVNSTLTNQVTGLESQVSKLQTQLNAASEADKNAVNAHEGICYTTNYDYVDGSLVGLEIAPPTVDNGVYECTDGMTFVSVTPTAATPTGEQG